MRARPILLLILAVVIAGGTAILARSWLAAQRSREAAQAVQAPAPKPVRSVLVAKTPIGRGEILRPEQLTWQTWPDGDIDKAYITQGNGKSPQSFGGWVAINPITSGEPITLAKVIAPGDRGFLAAVLHPGMRAISIPVTVTSGISGFIFPGDRVDLLLTYPVPTQKSETGQNNQQNYEHKATETVMRDVRVIGIDQRLQSKAGEAVVAHTATFEVTPKQAEVIALANEIGKLSLTLHSLVQAPAEPPAATPVVQKVADTGMTPSGAAAPDTVVQPATDSPISEKPTYTLDSEISPLLPKASGEDSAPKVVPLTILHGLNEKQINFPLRSAPGGG